MWRPDSDGIPITCVGQIVCRGQRQVVLLSTHPYKVAGRIVEIPVEAIIGEAIYAPARS